MPIEQPSNLFFFAKAFSFPFFFEKEVHMCAAD